MPSVAYEGVTLSAKIDKRLPLSRGGCRGIWLYSIRVAVWLRSCRREVRRQVRKVLDEGFVEQCPVRLEDRSLRDENERHQGWQRTSMAAIFPFMNWFSVAALSNRSRVRFIGFRALSTSASVCIGTIVRVCCAMSSIAARWPMTSFLTGSVSERDAFKYPTTSHP